IATAIRGSRRRLRSFWRPSTRLMRSRWPSHRNHCGVTWGAPFLPIVAMNATARERSRSWKTSGIAVTSGPHPDDDLGVGDLVDPHHEAARLGLAAHRQADAPARHLQLGDAVLDTDQAGLDPEHRDEG